MNKYESCVSKKNKCLLHTSWQLKMHKDLTKARFTKAVLKHSLRPLSKSITAAFKILFDQIESYKDHSQYISGIDTFWTILTNQSVINGIDHINK